MPQFFFFCALSITIPLGALCSATETNERTKFASFISVTKAFQAFVRTLNPMLTLDESCSKLRKGYGAPQLGLNYTERVLK